MRQNLNLIQIMKQITLSIIALFTFIYADAQGYYYFKDSTGTNPGNLNTEATEYPVSGGIGGGWLTILGPSNTLLPCHQVKHSLYIQF